MKTRSQNKYKNLKKGLGLVEVLISLVLISTSMILAIRTVSRGLKVAKDNEIRDTAAGVLLRALEFNQVEIPPNFIPSTRAGYKECYSLKNLNSSQTIFDTIVEQTNANCSPVGNPEITSCDASSPYLLNIDSAQICNQIIITNYPLGSYELPAVPFNDNRIRITSVVVYTIEGEEIVETISTFRNV